MQYNGHQMHPPDHTAILLDQTQELRKQSNALGWIMSQLNSGSEVHKELRGDTRELKAAVQELKSDVAQLRAVKLATGQHVKELIADVARLKTSNKPLKLNVIADSLAGLLHAGRPYLVCVVLVAGKLLGLGPSWIEPLIEKLAKALLS